ncbi:uncharacterized protein LOC110621444 [Manihot esculenta]|uniref:uncharacterized protein LOC110621444 n=1 Tax=Manihot esculenta TaxID=3983 RepID=UPI001CC35E98|nr:uncharacterized protein LOC110621444 [Manihot esculenta]
MPYPPYYPPYPPYPMFSPPPFYQNLAKPNPESAAPPPPPPSEPVIPEAQPPKPNPSAGKKVKMTYYLKLDAPKCKEGDDSFEYIKAVKMIANELGANDSRAIQMAGFTLECKKVKEWFKNYVDQKLDDLSSEQFANEFAGWAFPDNSRELKFGRVVFLETQVCSLKWPFGSFVAPDFAPYLLRTSQSLQELFIILLLDATDLSFDANSF